MQSQLEILRDVTSRLDSLSIPYMLNGSLALSYYAQPRMTRDIDLVLILSPDKVGNFEETFSGDYFLQYETVKEAIEREFMFNLIHLESSLKVDCIVRKKEEYRIAEFNRRRKVRISDFNIYIVSKEDLIISKLVWIKESDSELQKNDVKNLIATGIDEDYLLIWIKNLDLEQVYYEVRND